jgi:hypothetical protein
LRVANTTSAGASAPRTASRGYRHRLRSQHQRGYERHCRSKCPLLPGRAAFRGRGRWIGRGRSQASADAGFCLATRPAIRPAGPPNAKVLKPSPSRARGIVSLNNRHPCLLLPYADVRIAPEIELLAFKTITYGKRVPHRKCIALHLNHGNQQSGNLDQLVRARRALTHAPFLPTSAH